MITKARIVGAREDPEFGAIIFAVETDEHGEEILRPIDDDDEFDAVSKAIEILNEISGFGAGREERRLQQMDIL